MAREQKYDVTFTIAALVALLLVFFLLITEIGRGLDENYVFKFALIFLGGIVGILVLWAVSASLKSDDDEYEPLVFDSSRVLGNWPARGIAAVVLMLVFAGGALLTDQGSVIPVINPYDSGKLITPGETTFSTEGQVKTALRTGTYPGFGEEFLGYVFTSGLTFVLLYFAWRKIDEDAMSNPLYVIISAFVASGVWGFVFSTAHSTSYGLNTEAYYAAFIFGWVTQFVNQLVGGPVSILAHFAHNFLFVVGLTTVLSIGGVAAAIVFRGNGMKRKGNVGIYALIGIIIIALIGAAFYFSDSNALSTITPACIDWTPIPESPVCSTNQDCADAILGGASPDSGTGLRCNAGTCEVRFQECAEELS